MIESMRIAGFRAARDVALQDLGGVNLFIGPNGTGKTALLNAVFLFCVDADAAKLLVFARPETSQTDADGLARALSWQFSHTSENLTHVGAGTGSAAINISGMVGGISRKVTVTLSEPMAGFIQSLEETADEGARSVTPSPTPVTDLNAVRASAKLIVELVAVHGGVRSTGKVYLSSTYPPFGESDRLAARMPASITSATTDPPPIAKFFDEAQAAGNAKLVGGLLQKVDPNVRELKIGVGGDGSPVLRVDHARLGVCPLNVLGDGLSAALHFALVACAGKFKFVMFDEFDARLHVTVLRHLASFARTIADGGVQLFLTTHRADTLGAFVDLVEDGWDGLRVFQTRLNERGEIQVQGFGGSQLVSVWRELALDIRVPS